MQNDARAARNVPATCSWRAARLMPLGDADELSTNMHLSNKDIYYSYVVVFVSKIDLIFCDVDYRDT